MFRGVGTALITPFKDNGEIDYKKYEALLEFQIQNEIDALIVLGTTGESPTISIEERRELTKIAVKMSNGQVPVIVGTGSNDTEKVLKLNKIAEEDGADGLLIVTPYYNKTNQAGLVKNYNYIAENTSLPIILYNVPSRTGVNILPETAKELSKIENIVAIKEASGDMSQVLKTINLCSSKMKVLSGNDDQAFPLILSGGDGVISVFSNLAPKAMKQITTNIFENDYQKAREIFYKYLNLMNLMFIDVNPIPIKFAMSKIGLSNNNLRKPLFKLSKEKEELILQEMRKLGMI
ncbi:4-hydroxy-tetrahydrodipicolinate synthase [Geotoga petraea]|jgi:4-hydroxy-tetrahydrodipicolinate synthase|uniref:4-hydroxy-tetrahydrodipicolinate synthase n=1 Tax=Geotoga petraea TaxID=28234 RepID=A0A4Z0VZ24_9BACT|nr:4-hydroxy-tetrahydrodipicolinate synthase [Geotoga petraea]TGG87306.1 4-hydroxy-tetrahydrodipicolinate synthase [Geotoga petraea]